MSAAHAMEVPVPRFISYGSHTSCYSWGTILMTRIPGQPLSQCFSTLSPAELDTVKSKLTTYLSRTRSYRNPWATTRICGVDGGDFYGARVPSGHLPACDDERAFHEALLRFAFNIGGASGERLYENAERMLSLIPHAIVFTHGDLWHHNIMAHNGHISGIIDWEWSGWFPEYWEFTSIMRWTRASRSRFLSTLPEYHYDAELESEMALVTISADSFSY